MNQQVQLRPHVKAGETRANTFFFSLGTHARSKANYLTLEELEWILTNREQVAQVIAQNRAIMNDAKERALRAEIAKGKLQEEKKAAKSVSDAAMAVMFKKFMEQNGFNVSA